MGSTLVYYISKHLGLHYEAISTSFRYFVLFCFVTSEDVLIILPFSQKQFNKVMRFEAIEAFFMFWWGCHQLGHRRNNNHYWKKIHKAVNDHELQKSFTSNGLSGKNIIPKAIVQFFYNLILIVSVIDQLKINSLLFQFYSLRLRRR